MSRIAPVEPPYDEETAVFLAKWMPPGSAVEPLKLFRTLIHHREFSDRMRPLGAGILGRGTLVPKEREIVINRVCVRCGCEYEWGVHVASFGQAVGLSHEQLMATADSAIDDSLWTGREILLLRLVDELHDTSTVSDALWSELAEQWDTPQIMELVIVAGFYHLIAFVANTAQVELEDWAARFPAQA